jgi:hypothetical protein
MLLYFAAVPNPLHGFYRALSIAERTPMPALKEQLPHIDMQCGILHTLEYERLVEREREQAQENEIETTQDAFISVDALHQVSELGKTGELLSFNRFYIMVNVNLVIHIDLRRQKIQKILLQKFELALAVVFFRRK